MLLYKYSIVLATIPRHPYTDLDILPILARIVSTSTSLPRSWQWQPKAESVVQSHYTVIAWKKAISFTENFIVAIYEYFMAPKTANERKQQNNSLWLSRPFKLKKSKQLHAKCKCT